MEAPYIDEHSSLLKKEEEQEQLLFLDPPSSPRRFLMLALFALCASVNISGFIIFAPVATILSSVNPFLTNHSY